MENHAMTGIFQSSPKCVYVITSYSYNQVIYKYVIYKHVQKKKQRQTMVLWFSIAQHSNSEEGMTIMRHLPVIRNVSPWVELKIGAANFSLPYNKQIWLHPSEMWMIYDDLPWSMMIYDELWHFPAHRMPFFCWFAPSRTADSTAVTRVGRVVDA